MKGSFLTVTVAGDRPIFRMGVVCEVPLYFDKDSLIGFDLERFERLVSIAPSCDIAEFADQNSMIEGVILVFTLFGNSAVAPSERGHVDSLLDI